jgi:hypothetical protein
MSREDYKSFIEENLRPHLGKNYRYQKNSELMYSLLNKYGDQNQAIKWADDLSKLYEGQTNYADHNPCTLVYKLVEELAGLQNHV